jgi:hypothetical protein
MCRGVTWPGVNTSTPKESESPRMEGSKARAYEKGREGITKLGA